MGGGGLEYVEAWETSQNSWEIKAHLQVHTYHCRCSREEGLRKREREREREKRERESVLEC